MRQHRHREFQFPLWYAVHLGTESEHQVLNGSHIFVSITRVLLLFGTNIRVKGDEMKKENNIRLGCHKRLGAYLPFHTIGNPYPNQKITRTKTLT